MSLRSRRSGATPSSLSLRPPTKGVRLLRRDQKRVDVDPKRPIEKRWVFFYALLNIKSIELNL